MQKFTIFEKIWCRINCPTRKNYNMKRTRFVLHDINSY